MPNFEVELRWAAQQRRHWDQQLEPARRETRATSSAQGKFFFLNFCFILTVVIIIIQLGIFL